MKVKRKVLEKALTEALKEIDLSKKRITKPRKLPQQKLDSIANKMAQYFEQERLPELQLKYVMGKVHEILGMGE